MGAGASKEDLTLVFQGYEKIVREISNGSDIAKRLGQPEDKCPILQRTVNMATFLGGGMGGDAYEVVLYPNGKPQKYVVKKSKNLLSVDQDTKANFRYLFAKNGIKEADLLSIQPQNILDRWNKIGEHENIRIYIPVLPCTPKKAYSKPAIPSTVVSSVNIPAGSYICQEPITEYIIGVYMGRLYRENRSIAFFDFYSMLICDETDLDTGEPSFHSYTFMQKIVGSYSGKNYCIRKNAYRSLDTEQSYITMNSVYIQLLFAIAIYQEAYNVSHNDLHQDNIFLDHITDETEFNGQSLKDADWFSYDIRIQGIRRKVYFPASTVIIKIGDFGKTVMYPNSISNIIIGDEDIFSDGYDGWMTNVYTPSYDSFYSTMCFTRELGMLNDHENVSPLIKDCMRYMCNLPEYSVSNADLNSTIYNTYVNMKKGYRPILEKIHSIKDAKDIILNVILKTYSVVPSEGKIVNIGWL